MYIIHYMYIIYRLYGRPRSTCSVCELIDYNLSIYSALLDLIFNMSILNLDMFVLSFDMFLLII